jgi:transcription elongation factor GreA
MTDSLSTATHKIVQLTKQGMEELQAELKELVEIKLPAAIDRVAKAREYGDLAENAEYHSARDDQALLETRIADIEDILKNATVVSQTKSHTVVGVGSQVSVSIVGKKGKKLQLSIVGEFEANPSEGKISAVSPLGKALMGKKKNDEVIVKAPAGDVKYLIEDVK